MNIETPEELAEYLADQIGVYGGHEDGEERPCRCCFTSEMTERIIASVRNLDGLGAFMDAVKEAKKGI